MVHDVGVSRRALLWLASVPLMVAGSFSAHELSYWLIAPDPLVRAHMLEASGHGYLARAPLVLGVLGALLVAALVLRVAGSRRGAAATAVARWPFFLLPLVGFSLQEHLERFLHLGELPTAAAIEPTFLVGLALQLPFALAALVLARLLLRAADRVGNALRARHSQPYARPLQHAIRPCSAVLPLQRVAGLGYTERGPPVVAV